MSHLRTRSGGSKVFLISGVTEEVRKDLAKKINQLGGKFFDLQYFKAICTHVICGKLSKSEKFLGACASGKWVLHPDYIYQSLTAGAWLDEEQYEWCDRNVLLHNTNVSASVELLYASRRWRFELGDDRHGAFCGWKVAVVAGAQKSKVMKRLLISGGAEVFNLSLPVKNPARVADTLGYIFVSEQNIGMVAHLFEYGVLCVKPDFIGDYLLKDPAPDPMDYLIQQTGVVNIDREEPSQSSGHASFLAESQYAVSFPASSNTPAGAPGTPRSSQDMLLNLLDAGETKAVPGMASHRESPRISSLAVDAKLLSPHAAEETRTTPATLETRRNGSANTLERNGIPSTSTKSTVPVKHQTRSQSVHVIFVSENEGDNKTIPSLKKHSKSDISSQPLDRHSKSDNSNQQFDRHSKSDISNQLLDRHGKSDTSSQLLDRRGKSDISSQLLDGHSKSQTIATPDVPVKHQTRSQSVHIIYESKNKGDNISSPSLKKHIKSDISSQPLDRHGKSDISSQLLDRHGKSDISSQLLDRHSKSDISSQLLDRHSKSQTIATPDGTQSSSELKVKPDIESVEGCKNIQCLPDNVSSPSSQGRASLMAVKDHSTGASKGKSLLQTDGSAGDSPNTEPAKPRLDVTSTPQGTRKVRKNSTISLSPITTFFKPVYLKSEPSKEPATPTRSKPEPQVSMTKGGGVRKCLSRLVSESEATASHLQSAQESDGTSGLGLGSHSASQISSEATISTTTTQDSCSQGNSKGSSGLTPADSIDVDMEEDQQDSQSSQKGAERRPRKRKSGQGSGLQQYFRENKRQKLSETEWQPTKFSINYRDGEALQGVLCMHSAKTQIIHTMFEEEELTVMALQELRARVSKTYCPPAETLALLIHHILPRAGSDLEANLVSEVLLKTVHHHPPDSVELQQLYLQALAGDKDTVAVGQEWRTIHTCIRNILNGEDSDAKRRNLLLFQFIRELLQQNLQHFVLQEKMCKGVKHLWLRILWCPSYHVVFNSRCRELLDLMTDTISLVRTRPEQELKSQLLDLLQDIVWLIAMAAECCRLEESKVMRGVQSLQVERVAAFVHEISRRLIDANLQDKWLLESVLSGLQLPWLCVGVCQQLLNTLDDYLLTESSPRDTTAVSLAVIVGHYFYLLPRLHMQSKSQENSKPVQNYRGQSSSKRLMSKGNGLYENTSMNQQDLDKQCKKVNSKNQKGETLLHRACIKGDATKVRQLLQVPGIDVNAKDNFGWTPLHEACNHGYTECVRELLKFVPSKSPSVAQYFSKGYKVSKVDLFACNKEGITPLHDAVLNNCIEVAQVLLQHGGAKLLSAVTSLGYKPVDLAQTDEMRLALNSFMPVQRRMSDSQESISSSQETSSGMDGVCLAMPSDMLYEEVLTCDGSRVYADKQAVSGYLYLVSALVHNYILAMGLESARDRDKNFRPQAIIHSIKGRPPESADLERGCLPCSCNRPNCQDCFTVDKENIPSHQSDISSVPNSLDSSEVPTGSCGSDNVNIKDLEERKALRKDMKVFKHMTKYVHTFQAHLFKLCCHEDRDFVMSELLELQCIL